MKPSDHTPGFIFLATLLSALSCHAAVIYHDDFNRNGSLHGSAPTVRDGDHSTATWLARDSWATDGSSALTTTTGQNSSLSLPFTPETGRIYELTVSMSTSGITTTDSFQPWLAFGFSNSPTPSTTQTFANGGAGGRSTANFTSQGNFRWYEELSTGAVSQAGVNLSSITGAPVVAGQYYDFKLVLNTIELAWSVDLFIEGTQIDLNGADGGNSHVWGTNPTIRSIMVSANTTNNEDATTGRALDSITLATVPEPAASGLFAMGCLAFLWRRRTAAGHPLQ